MKERDKGLCQELGAKSDTTLQAHAWSGLDERNAWSLKETMASRGGQLQ